MIKIGLIIVFSAYLASCGVSKPSTTLYPRDWAPLVEIKEATTCPDISGEYRILSEIMPRMEFPPGDKPVEWAFFIPIHKGFSSQYPHPYPSDLEPRFLPAHLFNADINKTKRPEWGQLMDLYRKFTPSQNEPDKEWVVEVKLINDERLEVVIKNQQNIFAQRILTLNTVRDNQTGKFTCHKGGLEIFGDFMNTLGVYSALDEQLGSHWGFSGGGFTFNKGKDGSLVMREDDNWCAGDCTYFGWQTWWRWPLIEKLK